MLTRTLSVVKNVWTPDVSREFTNGKVEFVKLPERTLAYLTLKPGWKWSKDIKPMMKTKSCECSHLQYVISGRLKVRMDDGSDYELRAGDCCEIAPGHDAWVLGTTEFRCIDFNGDELLRHMEEAEGSPGGEPLAEDWL